MTFRDYWNLANKTGKYAMLVHCCDFGLSGVQAFVNVESLLGLRSTFFLRTDADYFSQSLRMFQHLESQGWEIGYEYDCLSRSGNDSVLARSLMSAQVSYMRTFFNVTSTNEHGDNYDFSVNNSKLWDRTVWTSLALKDIFFDLNMTYSNVSDSSVNGTPPITLPSGLFSLLIVEMHSDWTR